MRLAGTFSGIGGLELPFHKGRVPGATTALLCDWWEPSQQVLKERFPGATIAEDVADLAKNGLPDDVTALTAGFPCTDLSQAGRTAGSEGQESGQVRHVFQLLREHPNIDTLVLENVRNMLVLDKGAAMTFLIDELEALGFRWAYRLVDSRFTGVPQRRHRVILLATRGEAPDPVAVLFADDAPEPDHDDGEHLRQDAFGFYWTEGLRGLGWAVDAVPPLKGGSSVGIPSPPAFWHPSGEPGRKFLTPAIHHAEALQGFPAGWTSPAASETKNGPRWKLVGNAVTVGVTHWLAGRLAEPGTPVLDLFGDDVGDKWPTAAWGDNGKRRVVDASTFPTIEPYRHLTDVAPPAECDPLSHRAASGFADRLGRSSLRRPEQFDLDLVEHIATMS